MPISSPSSSSHFRNGDEKPHKRSRSGGGGSRNRRRYRRSLSTETNDAKPSPENGDIDASDEGRRKQPGQRLYHGVCPDVSNRYRKVGDGRIGQGTYGVVYCARDVWKEELRGVRADDRNSDSPRSEKRNEIVALKKCYAHHEASDGFPITTLREIHALRICSSHPNIVDLLEVAVSSGNTRNSGEVSSGLKTDNGKSNNTSKNDNNCKDGGQNDDKRTKKPTIKIGKSNVFLVFEHCRYDLAQILDSHHEHQQKIHRRKRGSLSSSSPFSLSETKTLALQLLSALEFCHGHGIIHRDIKPSNLLYDTTTGRLKVCDFGLSRTASEENVHMTPNVVSLWYRAPELLLSAARKARDKHSDGDDDGDYSNSNRDPRIRYSFPIDLWAVGCVVAELLQGQPFLDGTSEIEQVEKMQDALGPPPSDLYSLPPTKRTKSNHHHTTMGLWDRFEHLPPEGLTLLARLLEYDPSVRWTAAVARKSGFLAPTSDPAPILDLGRMPRGFPGC